MKKNIVIGVLSVLVVGLSGVLVYMGIQNKEKDTKEPEKNNTQEGEVGNNTNIEETKKEYIHFTSTELKFDKDEETGIGIMIEVKDGKLVETSNTGLTFSGIEGKVKYFTYDIDCAGLIGFLVLTEENKVYAASYDYAGTYGESDKNIAFIQVKTDEVVTDITEFVNPIVTSCSGIYLGVVLENGKIYGVEDYRLGMIDYSAYKDKFVWTIIYSDNTVAATSEASENKKIQYNNQKIIAKKIYKGGTSGFSEIYYIQDKNDKLYKVEIEADEELVIQTKNVSLVKDAIVGTIEKQDDSHIKVTYKDNTTDELEVKLEYGIYDATK